MERISLFELVRTTPRKRPEEIRRYKPAVLRTVPEGFIDVDPTSILQCMQKMALAKCEARIAGAQNDALFLAYMPDSGDIRLDLAKASKIAALEGPTVDSIQRHTRNIISNLGRQEFK